MFCWGVRVVVNDRLCDYEVDVYIVGLFVVDLGYGVVVKFCIGDDDLYMLMCILYFDEFLFRI